jgi:hypothetical protein
MVAVRWLAATRLTQRSSDQLWRHGTACIWAISLDHAIGTCRGTVPRHERVHGKHGPHDPQPHHYYVRMLQKQVPCGGD